MSDNLNPGLGTIIEISDSAPATEDLSGYEALSFTAIGEVTEIPEFGPSHETVEHTALADGVVKKYHGSLNNGSLTTPMALDRNDAGQDLVRAALANKARQSFKVAYPDGTADYFQGKIMSFTRAASLPSVVVSNAQIEIETDLVSNDTPA